MDVLALLMTAFLFGGMTLYSFGFAPFLFNALPAETAGPLIRKAFPWYYLFVIGAAVVAGGMLLARDWLSAMLLIVVAVLGVMSRQKLMPMINDARDRQLAGEHVAKRRFATLHGASVGINFVQLGLVAWVLVRFL
ncbi:DUF4149 domain-containing protein [Actibacterium sp. 188UL27-1]|uniref:DUF4149 domain-containing protein n=1 Tax=Actibacterium sp. 188UL27-1 TaxID=2786961 RepID=UPI00195E99E4|nr:DUF4149 domain-containing protein [Actibacterium sp. 188UL27-1]MBM7069459.1 DUF4149 domain-containing protein [Actibacterium sp. 188UL27-1]